MILSGHQPNYWPYPGLLGKIMKKENIKKYNLPYVVAINRFGSDTEKEIEALANWSKENNHPVALSEVFAKGGEGGIELANKLLEEIELHDGKDTFKPIYDETKSIEEKISTIVKEIYGADGVEFTTTAKNQIKTLNENGWDKLPICMAKTQYSLSDDPTLLGRPNGFEVTIQDLIPNTGAGFLVAIAGDIMRMPGLPKVPAAVHMDIDEEGTIVGLF